MELIQYSNNSGITFEAEKLKECPFCGLEAEILFKGNDYTKKRSVKIRCTNIDCRCEIVNAGIKLNHNQVAKNSIKDWNRRVS